MSQHSNESISGVKELLIVRVRNMAVEQQRQALAWLESCIEQKSRGVAPEDMTFPEMTPDLASLLTGKPIRERGKQI